MAHLQYMPGDPRLVDQLVYELKSKGIFDQFRKDCIADVDTRPAYQNLRQRVENSVSTFLSRQSWQPDLNKNQLREKLRKHILDGNYLEQGVERIVDQVVNPKVASVFIPKVEDLVYNYLGITRKKSVTAETSNGKIDDLLPTDLEAVSPGSVKSNNDIDEEMETDNVKEESKMEVDDESKSHIIGEVTEEKQEEQRIDINLSNGDSNSNDKCNIPLPAEIKVENIPPPENSPPKVELDTIELPKDPIIPTDIPLPDDISKEEKDKFFKQPVNSDEEESSSDSSLRRNMSPLTPIRNFNNENSYDAQQAFENDTSVKENDKKEPSSFRFAIEAKTPENTTEEVKIENKDTDVNLSYQFSNQVNINNFNTPTYEDSSNSNNLQIDYESDANSKVNIENKVPEIDHNSDDSKKDKKSDEKRSSHKSSHRSRDSHRDSSRRDKRSDSKHSSIRESKHDKSKSYKDESKSKSSDKEKSREKSDKKDEKRERDSSRHRSSHKSSHKDSKSHRSSSSSHRHSSKHSDDKKSSSSSSQKEKDKSEKSGDKPKDSRSSSHRSDKDRKSSSSSSKSDKHKHKDDNKQKDKKKKESDDHYSVSGRNNPNRRSTDRDSNDGSSSSKGSHHPSSSKSSQSKKESKSSSKSESTSNSGDSTSPSDKENVVHDHSERISEIQNKPVIRVESHLELPVASPPRLPFVPDVTIKKPKFAANLEEAKRLMKMRKFLDEEQKRMNQEAALLLEFQANVRPSLSQVYSNIPGPELEFACIPNMGQSNDNMQPHYTNNQLLNVLNDATIEVEKHHAQSNKVINHVEETNEVDDICNYNKSTSDADNTSNDKNTVEQENLGENKSKTEFEVTLVDEEDSESEANEISKSIDSDKEDRTISEESHINGEIKLQYFAEHEKYNAEIERAKFSNFLKEYSRMSNKIYLINCNTYEEKLIRDESKKLGDFEIISYQKNGHLLPRTKNVIKDVNISTEISLPYTEYETSTFSSEKSECFELVSDYDAKLEEMVNKASRQEIMEIILGNVSASPSKMPRIDYVTDSKIDNDYDNDFKRKLDDSIANNNRPVLTPNKIRRLSADQITSTTQEDEERPNNKLPTATRSKYLGKARRVGLPRPKRTVLPQSPSSDKSVENYEQTPSPNGKIKRSQVQRYDTSDLYKPKLHYLSRRNHFT